MGSITNDIQQYSKMSYGSNAYTIEIEQDKVKISTNKGNIVVNSNIECANLSASQINSISDQTLVSKEFLKNAIRDIAIIITARINDEVYAQSQKNAVLSSLIANNKQQLQNNIDCLSNQLTTLLNKYYDDNSISTSTVRASLKNVYSSIQNIEKIIQLKENQLITYINNSITNAINDNNIYIYNYVDNKIETVIHSSLTNMNESISSINNSISQINQKLDTIENTRIIEKETVKEIAKPIYVKEKPTINQYYNTTNNTVMQYSNKPESNKPKFSQTINVQQPTFKKPYPKKPVNCMSHLSNSRILHKPHVLPRSGCKCNVCKCR